MSQRAENQQLKEDSTALLRALAGDETLQVEFDEEKKNYFVSLNQNLISGDKKITLPFEDDEISQASRAALDLALCYYLFHDSALHGEKKFDESEQKIFDEFEKIRVISNVENIYLGSLKNILGKIEDESFILSESLALLLLPELNPQNILPRTQNSIINLTRKTKLEILQQIKKLAQNISNQQAFAADVEQLLDMMRQKNENEEQQEESKKDEKNSDDLKSQGTENIDDNEQQENSGEADSASSEQNKKEENPADLKEGDGVGEVSIKVDAPSAREEKIEFKNAYKIFNSQFDEVVFPQKLVSKKELEILYDQLELKLSKLLDISRKASLKFKKKLLSKRNAALEFDSSKGILNRKKLTRIVLDPTLEDIWINNHEHEYQNTALTILLDNSGSMRGQPIVMSALACKMIAEILEKFSVKTEIIGFTTADWKGGRARKIWEASGRQKNPGRLNELRHIIYKPFNSNFKKSKINLGLMLKEGILKENIDGEALLFARARLMQQSEKRKILMVISDGTPIDDSTLAVNDSDILSDHLHHVVNKIEKAGKVEIVGIGIGHDTSDFYRNSMTIKNLEELSDVMIDKLCQIL